MRKKLTFFLILIFILGLTPIDFSNAQNLSSRLSGKILLQVEANGEGWYVYPDNLNRYYLGRPADAFSIMRELGLGISENNYNSFNGYAPSNLSGKILLRVEAKGEAYYVNPDDFKMHYLGRPADAFKTMRELGLGISNGDLSEISISEKSITPENNQSNISDGTSPQNYNHEEETKTADINDYITGVVLVECFTENPLTQVSQGSGTLWDLGGSFGYGLLSNDHVLSTKACSIGAEGIVIQTLDTTSYDWNSDTDIAVRKIKESDPNFNYKISYLDKCDHQVPRGKKLYVIGYPAFVQKEYETPEGFMGLHNPPLTITEGVISSYDRYVEGDLPYVNYYVSAKIDSGNSGGIALVKDGDDYCVLGVPTWLSVGNYETQGVVQNIHNIMYK